MRLGNLIIVFAIHACLSLYYLATHPVDYSGIGAFLLFPVRQLMNLTGLEISGYLIHLPYLINSFIWSFLIVYFYGVLKNTVRDRFD